MIHQVLARFQLDKVTPGTGYYKKPGSEEHTETKAVSVQLNAIKGEPFGSATPSGRVEMFIINPPAAQMFLDAPIGTEFDLLFTPHVALPHEEE